MLMPMMLSLCFIGVCIGGWPACSVGGRLSGRCALDDSKQHCPQLAPI